VKKNQNYDTFTGQGDSSGNRSYIISKEKAKMVDFAIKLGKPLLVEGEAGCGKTQLAYAIAEELGLEEPIIVPVRSSSRANDLFYRFDALRRLQDSHIESKHKQAEYAHNYITLEPLGEAIAKGQSKVILIDEVDKGDVDFQNDLLFALEQFRFPIDEIPQSEREVAYQEKNLKPIMDWSGGRKPIILFTSNREKPLPLPFLRRCIFLELTFPENPQDLTDIVEQNLKRRFEEKRSNVDCLKELSSQVIEEAVISFLSIREQAALNNAFKKPSTAELIDWVHVLHEMNVPKDSIAGSNPPYWEILFKSAEDQKRLRKSA
jgi:MoxR-like ATPase